MVAAAALTNIATDIRRQGITHCHSIGETLRVDAVEA